MEDKKINGYPVYSDDMDITNVVSSGELTGLQPRPPANEDELESYASLFNTPQPMNALNGQKPAQTGDKQHKPPKRILPL